MTPRLPAAQAEATADAATVSGDDLAVLFSGSSSLPPSGTLRAAIGQALQGPVDGDAIVARMMAIVGAFLPAAQLALPEFRQAKSRARSPYRSGTSSRACPQTATTTAKG